MSINSPEQLEKLLACGRVVAKALRAMADAVRPGVTTADLSAIASKILDENGAQSSPPLIYKFPGDVCISVNDEVVHGIPGPRTIQPGDLVKLDLTAVKDGYHTDSALTIQVPPTQEKSHALAQCAERAFRQALTVARIGNRTRDIGRAVERESAVAASTSSANWAATVLAAPSTKSLASRTTPPSKLVIRSPMASSSPSNP